MKYPGIQDINTIVSRLPTATIAPSVLKLMLKQQYEQRSTAWYQKRASCLTASDCATVLGINQFQNRKSLVKKKLSTLDDKQKRTESIESVPYNCLHGIMYEEEAANQYLQAHPELGPFLNFGLLMHDYHTWLGASPDKVTKDGILIEIKSPP